MKIHEYQAKEVLARFGVAVPRFQLARTADEADAAAKALGTQVCVVKAQVHAGGRGKAGGVKVVKDPAQVRDVASKIIGMTLVSPQTGPEGTLVRKVIVEEGLPIEKEFYLAVVLDRARSRPVMMASTEGGVEIEEVAAKHPEKIVKEWIDPALGLQPWQARALAFKLGIPKASTGKFVKLAISLAKAFVETDSSMAEINPLVLLKGGEMMALDAKVNFDDNALFRHKDLEALRDLDEEKPAEIEAKKYDLSYIKLDGEIGCLVNGAGLAMATMDIIKLHGGEPANFLDVGGGATQAKVTAAFKIILTDPNVKAILVNIFGGIMKCDIIAQGVMAAAREVGLKVPLVVRLEGTNVELGRNMLRESGLALEEAADLTDAATKVVAAAKRAKAG